MKAHCSICISLFVLLIQQILFNLVVKLLLLISIRKIKQVYSNLWHHHHSNKYYMTLKMNVTLSAIEAFSFAWCGVCIVGDETETRSTACTIVNSQICLSRYKNIYLFVRFSLLSAQKLITFDCIIQLNIFTVYM